VDLLIGILPRLQHCQESVRLSAASARRDVAALPEIHPMSTSTQIAARILDAGEADFQAIPRRTQECSQHKDTTSCRKQ
jgi:hypothetical protein